MWVMPKGLKRIHGFGHLHFITFSCYRRLPLLGSARSRNTFVETLGVVRDRCGFRLVGYVVMPEHVHILISEPRIGTHSTAMQAPDAVITDIIMPDKDGYEVCQFIKQHDQFGATPVILMSGVVNRTVAEKAMAVKADELIRKPFQPQDLIARVKNLLYPKRADAITNESSSNVSGGVPSHIPSDVPRPSSHVLNSLFSAGPVPMAPFGTNTPRAIASSLVVNTPRPAATVPGPAPAPRAATSVAAPLAEDVQRLRNEILRLEFLVKKLQAELEAEHQYCAALEAHFKDLQENR